MNKDIIFQSLLQSMKIAYSMNSEMVKFAPFPNDIICQDVVPHHCKCSNYFLIIFYHTSYIIWIKWSCNNEHKVALYYHVLFIEKIRTCVGG